MSDVKALKEERASIFEDLYNNKIPKRVPISIGLTLELIANAAGLIC